ncbi:hypothetical protein PINS_up007663 [Pythium insidiosum]|nr:hypothetical protein PINS_up007663 [Pythium insidiosum]
MASVELKRKWKEVDWEVVMAAQTFVAVFAADEQSEGEGDAGDGKGKTKARGRAAKAKAKPKPKPKTKAPAAPTTRALRRRGAKRAKAGDDEEEEEGEGEAREEDQEAPTNTPVVVAKSDGFWLAELQDDVTEVMLECETGVRITWLNQRPQAPTRYDYAYDDVIDVQSILCHVYLREWDDGSFELTPKSLKRVQRSLARSRGENADDGDADDDDDEKPPTSRRKRRATATADDDDDGDDRPRRRRSGGGGGGGRASRGTGARKLSKREEAMHIRPRYTTVDVEKYEDAEISGRHPFVASADDVMANSKEVIRAVVTKNHKLLKKLTSDKSIYKQLHSFAVKQSVDVKRTALHRAIEMDDLTAAGFLIKARSIEQKTLAKKPHTALPSHSTGKHTSAYSEYNRRAINASRGGREGNNALTEDSDGGIVTDEDSFLWEYNRTSVKMLTLLYPTGNWSDYNVAFNIAKACRSGNYRLAHKVIETLARNGGWGFNDLHTKVLSDSGEDLPIYRSVSAIKQAYQTKIRPLHLAAINPNVKYLEHLWENVGAEWSGAKDDLAYEPIHFAAACESTAPLAFLLEKKCNMFARTKHRQTPIMRAIATLREDNAIFIMEKANSEDPELLAKVVGERGPGSFQPIHYAAHRGCPKVLAYLLANGADANSVCEGKLTPLCLAAREGHYECVRLLIDHGAKVDMSDKLKKTPLLLAVKNGHTRIAAMLINAGANVNAYDTSDNSVVHYAASYGWKSGLQLLADAGADFWAKNSWGFVPLTCALLKQHMGCTEFILEHDPNHQFLDFRDRDGCTMLYLQCKHSTTLSQLKYLLNKGLNPNIPNSSNEHPLQAIIRRAGEEKGDDDEEAFFAEAARLLLENQAYPHYDIKQHRLDESSTNDSDMQLDQPLQLAITADRKDIFTMLLTEFNADPSKLSSKGRDVWMTAAMLGEKGEYYLKALLKHHSSHQNGVLDVSKADNNGDNFFHLVIAAQEQGNHLASPSLIRQVARKATDLRSIMNAKNKSGYSPLMRLLQQERATPSNDLRQPQHAEDLEHVKKADTRYSELVELYAEYSTQSTSWIRTIDLDKYKSEGTLSAHVTDADGSDSGSASDDSDADDSGSGSDNEDDATSNDSEKDESIKGSDDDDDGSDEAWNGQDAEEEGDETIDEAEVKPSKPPQGPRIVPHSSVLHFAAHRKLRTNAEDPNQKWFGKNLLKILTDRIEFDKTTLNMPDYDNFKTPLIFAVECGDVEGVEAILKHGVDPNHSCVACDECTKAGRKCSPECKREPVETALIFAIRRSDLVTCKMLLTHGADVNCIEKQTRNRAVHLALAANNAEMTELLLEFKADLSRLNSIGSSALHLAVAARHSVVVKQPHDGEVKYSNTMTAEAIDTAKTSAINVTLASDQAKAVIVNHDNRKRTPIHLAAANRDLELLRCLVGVSTDKKGCVNKADAFGRTPLHYAVNAAVMSPDASFDVERFLLQNGANPNAADQFAFTALHFALLKVDLDWHYKYKAKAQEENDGETPEEKKEKAFLKYLAKIPRHEADPVETVSNLASIPGIQLDAQDILGRTALHLAAAIGAFVCASSILANYPNKAKLLAIVDKRSLTPLGRAVQRLRQTTIMTMLQNGADVNGHVTEHDSEDQNDSPRRSYFYYAVKNSLTGICHMLLSAKFSKRQAVEDGILCGQFQLARNLMVGVAVSHGDSLLRQKNSHDQTLLHSLAMVNKPFDEQAREIAWTLVDAGVVASASDDRGCSPLHYAARTGNIHMMDFLIHHKCDLNRTNNAGETPLVFAIKESTASDEVILDIVKYFTDLPNVNCNVKDGSGANALSAFIDRFVSQRGMEVKTFIKWVEVFLEKGVDANGTFISNQKEDFFKNDRLGSSTDVKIPALIRVVYAATPSLRQASIGVLLRYGARVNVPDTIGNCVYTHLVACNMATELRLALGMTKTVSDPADPKLVHTVHVPAAQMKQAVNHPNNRGETAVHVAVRPLAYGSYENIDILDMLLASGGSLKTKDKEGRTPVDYTLEQSSRFIFRYLRQKHPTDVARDEGSAFDEVMEEWTDAPDFTADAATYLSQCEESGKIKKTRFKPVPNSNCDVGSLKRVHGELDAEGNVILGEEFDALLTKVDVKSGPFGSNVFYRCQIVHDQIQDIYVVFTNWGRIGEDGKYQNTPFHSAADAIVEFKKIFKAKTGNNWEDRHEFVKHNKRYNLIQRVNYHTTISDEVTSSFTISKQSAFAPSKLAFTKNVMEMLFAITDVRNLQLAATRECSFHDSLPLANAEELRGAIERLLEIRALLEERIQINLDMQKARADISEEGVNKLAELSETHTKLTEDISEKSSRYYEVMPVNEDAFGSPIKGFEDIYKVNEEIVRLRLIIDITHTYKMLLGAKLRLQTIHPLDYCYNAMQVHLTSMSADSSEAELLTKYFFNGIRQREHSQYRVSNIFQVSRRGEKKRMLATEDELGSLRDKHHQLLWHGTKRTNLMGILSQGLRIAPPEVSHQGYMYGKGLYFANTTLKSLSYCDAYVITSSTHDSDGKTVKKTRNVHYLLLCEVAMGSPTRVTLGSRSGKIGERVEGAESVFAMGRHTPDPVGQIVSPQCGAALSLGKIGEIGVAFPFDSVWAKTECEPQPWSYYDRNPKTGDDLMALWDRVVDQLAEGEKYEVEEPAEKSLFFNYITEGKNITVELVQKVPASEVGQRANCCDATIKIWVKEGSTAFSWQAKRYRNTFTASPLDDGFSLMRPNLDAYDELIVYNEGQARIRYLVEVERV